MFSYIFLTHGLLGKTLVETAEFIMDEDFGDRYTWLSIDYSMVKDMDRIQKELSKATNTYVKSGCGVIIFVDIFGGTPSNVALTLAKTKNVDIISGVNLAMVMYAFEHMDDNDMDISELVSGIIQSGTNNITSAKNLLNR